MFFCHHDTSLDMSYISIFQIVSSFCLDILLMSRAVQISRSPINFLPQAYLWCRIRECNRFYLYEYDK